MTDCSPSVVYVLVCDSKNAVINLTVIDLAMSIMQIVWLRKQADYLTFASLVWGFIVGVVRGQSLLVQPAWLPLHINLFPHFCHLCRLLAQIVGMFLLLDTPVHDVWLKRVIGLLLFAMGAFRAWRKCSKARAPAKTAAVIHMPQQYQSFQAAPRCDGDEAGSPALTQGTGEPLLAQGGSASSARSTAADIGSPQATAASQQVVGRRRRGCGAHSGLDLASWRVQSHLVASSAAAGLFAGLFGMGGPPLMLLVAYYEGVLDFQVWRGISAWMRFTAAVTRAIILVARDLGNVDKAGLRYLIMIVAAGLGLAVGNRLSPWVDPEFVPWAIIAFLMYASCIMAVAGSPEGEDVAVIVIPTTAILGGALYMYLKLKRRREAVEQHTSGKQ